MSAKSDFIRAVVEEGITMARKYFGTGVETQIKKSAGGQEKLDKAKAKFKQNKVDATKKKKSDAAKAKTKREKSKATEKGVRLRKNYEVQEGAALDAETGRSVSAARDVESGRAGKVTRGKNSVSNFIKDQMAISPGMIARSKQDDAFYRAINRAETDKEKTALREALAKIHKRREKVDTKQSESTARKISASLRGKPKTKRTDYVDPETGEVFGNPTQNQMRQAAKNFRARNMTSAARRVEAAMEEKSIQAGRTQAGETSVGPRKGGERGQRVRGEETQVKNMITGTRRDGVTNLRPENEDTLKARLNKGGKVTKKAVGAHDYRMNKGGLLLSSVDNRKKK